MMRSRSKICSVSMATTLIGPCGTRLRTCLPRMPRSKAGSKASTSASGGCAQFLGLAGPQGLTWGWMNDHIQLQPIVDVAPDGLTAHARSRELDMLGHVGGQGQWMEGVYENTFVKRHGVWMFKSLHFYPTFITDYDKGWALDAQPVPTASKILPPDRPPTQVYAIYPTADVPPFHYPNPVTGEMAHYPAVGAPQPALAKAALVVPGARFVPQPVRDVDAALVQAQTGIERVKDYYEIENLESAYGYYLDKDLWNDLANLFSTDGSMELAQRGAYVGREHVRAFLFKVFGRGKEGPVAGRLGNHMQLQPVIDVAPDGKSAKIRIRMFQQMSFGPRASVGAAVYENTAVLEDGKWKLQDDHTYNTLAAAYDGGWVRAANPGVPGPDKELPPDQPPTFKFQMFPVVYDIPFHYANPVTGNTTVPAILDGATPPPGFVNVATRPAAAGSPAGVPAPVTPVAGPHPAGMPDDIAGMIRGIGPKIDPRIGKLYAAAAAARAVYRCGSDPRCRLRPGAAQHRRYLYSPAARRAQTRFGLRLWRRLYGWLQAHAGLTVLRQYRPLGRGPQPRGRHRQLSPGAAVDLSRGRGGPHGTGRLAQGAYCPVRRGSAAHLPLGALLRWRPCRRLSGARRAHPQGSPGAGRHPDVRRGL